MNALLSATVRHGCDHQLCPFYRWEDDRGTVPLVARILEFGSWRTKGSCKILKAVRSGVKLQFNHLPAGDFVCVIHSEPWCPLLKWENVPTSQGAWDKSWRSDKHTTNVSSVFWVTICVESSLASLLWLTKKLEKKLAQWFSGKKKGWHPSNGSSLSSSVLLPKPSHAGTAALSWTRVLCFSVLSTDHRAWPIEGNKLGVTEITWFWVRTGQGSSCCSATCLWATCFLKLQDP